MKTAAILRELKSMGTAQNRKIYANHGVDTEMFGVSYGNLAKLKRMVRVDHEASLKLWDSGNNDAMVFATMIADTDQLSIGQLDAWVRTVSNRLQVGAISDLTSRHPKGFMRMKKWIAMKKPWSCSCGWAALSAMLRDQHPDLQDAWLRERLAEIEATIHQKPDRVRYSMNNALIGIGVRPGLTKETLAAAKRIGTVEVDHGDTSCKTPDAGAYIKKTLAHRKAANK
jgi:3-methyladenine DNA glycosylase AlkD